MNRDLRKVLIHEHAHRIVAESYGAIGRVDIWKNSNGGVDEKHFRGVFTLFFKPRDAKSLRIIGLAGSIASLIAEDPDLDACDVFDELAFNEEFSVTDRELAGGYTCADVEVTIALLRKDWQTIMTAVELDFRARYLP